MEGGELKRERYRWVAGEKGQMASPPECVCVYVCVAANYSWRLACGLQNLVCRHHFNLFGHSFTNPYMHGSRGHTISKAFT